KVLSNFFRLFLDWITGAFIVALAFNVSLYLCPFFRAGPPADLAAYIGAAAWLPIIIGWFYKLYITPKITIIPDEFPEVGFSTFGPIINLRMAITASRKSAVIDSIDLVVSHQDGEARRFHWSGMIEEVNQIVDEVGIAKQRVQKATDPIAFIVGVESVLVKFVKFQDRSFHQDMQPSLDALAEKVHFSKRQNAYSAAEILKSKEFDNLRRGWSRQFSWKSGQYVVSFTVGSPYPLNLTQVKLQFELSDTDIEILNKNLTINEDYHRACLKQAEDGTPLPTFQWNWRYPKAKKLRA
ncbi:MAG: hypothetical protein ACLQU4_20640, partial [Limisphaerales bacterium]